MQRPRAVEHSPAFYLFKELTMWYFSWILGLPLAAAFAVLNAMWFELMEDAAMRHDKLDAPS